jgi:L-malate glycosyltransferase
VSRQLRIGIACLATYGGSGVVATELGRELARLGHKVHFISKQMPFRLQGDFFENIYHHEVPTLSYDAMPGAMYGFEMASKLTQIAVDERLDLIHAHYAVPHAISGIMAKQVLRNTRDLKIVTTLHGTDITLVGRAPAFFPLTKWAIEESDAVTTVSNWLRDETYKAFEVSKPIAVIHNFVDTVRFNPRNDKAHRVHFAAADEKIILHLSNFRPVKRLQDVIAAFAEVLKEMPARLILIGDGPERERTLDLARKTGVMSNTYFLGKQNLIEKYFAIADLFLFPSEYESFGVAALEALSSGVPVVATEGSGIAEVVRQGVTGLLCPVGDAKALGNACVSVLSNPAMHASMGHLGRQCALRCFKASQIVENYLGMYTAILDGRPPTEPKPCVFDAVDAEA